MVINILMSKIAITYTEAFIKHAVKKLELTNSTIDIYRLGQIFVSSPEFDSFLKNPLISRNEKQKIIDIAIKDSVSSETYKFLSLLIQRNRINILKEITEVYDSIVVKESKFTIVNVRIPMALTPIQKENLEKKNTTKFTTLKTKNICKRNHRQKFTWWIYYRNGIKKN